MDWLSENWFAVIILIVFVAMHMFGHGHHGMHGHGGQHNHKNHETDNKK